MIRGCVPALAALVVAAGLAGAIAVVAAAHSTANGLPAYTNGYTGWKKLNKKPITGGSSAHIGVKNVYASKRRGRVQKVSERHRDREDDRDAGAARACPAQVAVMRKVGGRWRWVEYALSGRRYSAFAAGAGVHVVSHGREVPRLGLHQGLRRAEGGRAVLSPSVRGRTPRAAAARARSASGTTGTACHRSSSGTSATTAIVAACSASATSAPVIVAPTTILPALVDHEARRAGRATADERAAGVPAGVHVDRAGIDPGLARARQRVTDGADLRIGEDHAWRPPAVAAQRHRLAEDCVGRQPGLVLAHVREQCTAVDVADRVQPVELRQRAASRPPGGGHRARGRRSRGRCRRVVGCRPSAASTSSASTASPSSSSTRTRAVATRHRSAATPRRRSTPASRKRVRDLLAGEGLLTLDQALAAVDERDARPERRPGRRHLDADDAAAQDREPRRHRRGGRRLDVRPRTGLSQPRDRRQRRACFRWRSPPPVAAASSSSPTCTRRSPARRPRPRTSVTPRSSSHGSWPLSSRFEITSSRRAKTAGTSSGPISSPGTRAASRASSIGRSRAFDGMHA